MTRPSRQRIAVALLVVCLTLLLASCGSKATRENYDRVETGMEKDEAISILGQPDKTSDVSLGPLSGTTATWNTDEFTITIQFVNDKVAMKELAPAE